MVDYRIHGGGSISTSLDHYRKHVDEIQAAGHEVAVYRTIGTYDVTVYYGTAIETVAKYHDPKERIL